MLPIPIISSLIAIGSNWLAGIQKRQIDTQAASARVEYAVTEARISRVATGERADIEWAMQAQQMSGWKDEWFTILLSIPAVMSFIPGLAQYVVAGFTALESTPDWYKAAFGVAVASAFGYRKIVGMIQAKVKP